MFYFWQLVYRHVTNILNEFQRFIMILTEHIVRSEQQQLEVNTPWFKYTTERLREVLITVCWFIILRA